MANGFHGPKADWDRMAQLRMRLAPVLQVQNRAERVDAAWAWNME
jgi:hypothetical protein